MDYLIISARALALAETGHGVGRRDTHGPQFFAHGTLQLSRGDCGADAWRDASRDACGECCAGNRNSPNGGRSGEFRPFGWRPAGGRHGARALQRQRLSTRSSHTQRLEAEWTSQSGGEPREQRAVSSKRVWPLQGWCPCADLPHAHNLVHDECPYQQRSRRERPNGGHLCSAHTQCLHSATRCAWHR